MKLGIVGGTFDPIHVAHAYLMEECQQLLGLDQVLVIPNGDPPHKDEGVTCAAHRLAMVELALKDYPLLTVDSRETLREKPSYTVETLRELKVEAGKGVPLYFIVGADSLLTFPTWYQPEAILQLATLVLFDRPGYRQREVEKARRFVEAKGGTVLTLDSLSLEISSTEIRRRIAAGESHRSFLHPRVYDYIHDQGLYGAR
ncbi:Nicotinate-nucleotide adenylyltransferase [Clostridiaceae bacterium JG1575]|nr:Nicotinate-nucleotide adenylyltransferase [Clostridiaceae bacterium JG1575]